ncbi:hypothetical protein [Enterococcus crotali]|nr:hypothetical protein [Enterococcus crotali]
MLKKHLSYLDKGTKWIGNSRLFPSITTYKNDATTMGSSEDYKENQSV